MSQREQRFYLNDPENPEDEDEDDEEGEEEEEGDVMVDSADEEFEDQDDDRDNGHVNDVLSEDGSIIYSAHHDDDDDQMIDGPIEELEDDEDAMTWESLSTVSEEEVRPQSDEWYPMIERKTMFPNFALPTTTRPALNTLQQFLANVRTISPIGDEDALSDRDDPELQSYLEVMRPDPTKRELSEMVLEYFLHNGHSEVIETYCQEMGLPMPVEEIKEMEVRNEVKNAILQGNMVDAIEKMNAISPDIIKDDRINFVVRKQHIIEMVRSGQTVEPVTYFREHLMINGKRPSDERMEIIEKVFTLMVYSSDEPSEFHVFYEQKERQRTAKEVNSAILGVLGKPRFSRIDMLAKSMVWMRTEVMNSINTGPKLTTVGWANKYFGKPFGFSELIEKIIKREPLDFTKEFC